MRIILFTFFISILSNGYSQDSLDVVNAIDTLDTIEEVQTEEESFVNNENVEIELQEFEVDVIDIQILDTIYNKITSIYVLIPEATKKDVIKSWTKKTRHKTKEKYVVNGSDYEIRLTQLERIYHLPLVNIRTHIAEGKTNILLLTSIEVDTAKFMNKNDYPEMYVVYKKYVRDFAVEAYKKAVEEIIDEEEYKLEELKLEFARQEKENMKFHRTIADSEAKIHNTRNDIIEAENQQENLVDMIDKQQERVFDAISKDGRKDAKKELKSFQKEKKRLQKKVVTLEKRIVEFKSTIEITQRDIKKNLEDQAYKKKEIEDQIILVKTLTHKLTLIQ